ncbi:hypothetical protein B296_00024561 [Ensete ventricosum]|uniref:Uncharacterized protein n=1 Tax=Ensete ventricosum TaxID=4639 RepID=A0A426YV99_ENSVE|nr:hypothetical protein B296_00024561 [Ensete ventricosum]
MLQRAHQYITVETLVVDKRDKTKSPRVEQPQGHPPPSPKRREDRWNMLPSKPKEVALRETRPPRNSSPRPKGPVEKQIDVIFGGPALGGDSSSARKAYTRSEVRKRPAHDEDLDITFKSGGEEFPYHDDALVISICMANAYLPSAYNAIIGRPTLNRFKAVVSTYHRLLKFPTRTGVGEVRSDPREFRQCYLTTTTLSKKLKVQLAATVPQNPEDSARDPYPAEQVLEVPLDPSRLDRLVKVESGLTGGQLIQLQPLDLSQVAPDLVQFFFGGLEPLERLVSLPFGFLELLFQLGSTLLDLSDRLRTPARL